MDEMTTNRAPGWYRVRLSRSGPWLVARLGGNPKKVWIYGSQIISENEIFSVASRVLLPDEMIRLITIQVNGNKETILDLAKVTRIDVISDCQGVTSHGYIYLAHGNDSYIELGPLELRKVSEAWFQYVEYELCR